MTAFAQRTAADLNEAYGDLPPGELLKLLFTWYPASQTSFANSFGLEDIVIQHLLLSFPEQAESFVLDTGRLPEETYELIERWRLRFGLRPRIFSPRADLLDEFLSENGPNAFYQSQILRKSCCGIRKLEPLTRALAGKTAWISGLRREQSSARASLEVFAYDEDQRLKLSPLANWNLDQVWTYVREHNLPYNRLHDQGYPSIGCAPCTRAVSAGEDLRSGRWWWETDLQRECGLHTPRSERTEHATPQR